VIPAFSIFYTRTHTATPARKYRPIFRSIVITILSQNLLCIKKRPCIRAWRPQGRFLIPKFKINYSPGMIASLGQTLAQVPQSMQVSGSM
jgi:hypothetical protein